MAEKKLRIGKMKNLLKRIKALEEDLREALFYLEVSEKKRKTLEKTALRLEKELTEKKEWCTVLTGIIDGTKEFLKEEIKLGMERAVKANSASNAREVALSETILMFLGEDIDEIPMKLSVHEYSVLEMTQAGIREILTDENQIKPNVTDDSPQAILEQVRQAFKILGDKNYTINNSSHLARLTKMLNGKSRALQIAVQKNIADEEKFKDWKKAIRAVYDLSNYYEVALCPNHQQSLNDVINEKLGPLLK